MSIMSITGAVQRQGYVHTLPADVETSPNAGSCRRCVHMNNAKEVTVGLRGTLMNVGVIGWILNNGHNGLAEVAPAVAIVLKASPTAEGPVTETHDAAVGTLLLGPRGPTLVKMC